MIELPIQLSVYTKKIVGLIKEIEMNRSRRCGKGRKNSGIP